LAVRLPEEEEDEGNRPMAKKISDSEAGEKYRLLQAQRLLDAYYEGRPLTDDDFNEDGKLKPADQGERRGDESPKKPR
jgi:hypothetical protein